MDDHHIHWIKLPPVAEMYHANYSGKFSLIKR
nr:MAG TPA: hypothetical protein [Caudoviricetes sp.]